MVKIIGDIPMSDEYMVRHYTENLKPNEFFDEIEKIDHCINVPNEYFDRLGGHVCMCGKLIVSSFLPDEIRSEYNEYVHKKSMNKIIESGSEKMSDTISKQILDDMFEIGLNNKLKLKENDDN